MKTYRLLSLAVMLVLMSVACAFAQDNADDVAPPTQVISGPANASVPPPPAQTTSGGGTSALSAGDPLRAAAEAEAARLQQALKDANQQLGDLRNENTRLAGRHMTTVIRQNQHITVRPTVHEDEGWLAGLRKRFGDVEHNIAWLIDNVKQLVAWQSDVKRGTAKIPASSIDWKGFVPPTAIAPVPNPTAPGTTPAPQPAPQAPGVAPANPAEPAAPAAPSQTAPTAPAPGTAAAVPAAPAQAPDLSGYLTKDEYKLDQQARSEAYDKKYANADDTDQRFADRDSYQAELLKWQQDRDVSQDGQIAQVTSDERLDRGYLRCHGVWIWVVGFLSVLAFICGLSYLQYRIAQTST
jgi:hypothetical protein